MLLRTRLNILFLSSLFLVGIMLVVSSFITTNYFNEQLLESEGKGANSLWNKIVTSSFEQMSFYAYDDTPGKPSIWRLRGNRSPIAAVRSRDKRLLDRTIGPMYENLKTSEVIDFISITTDEHEVIYFQGIQDKQLDPVTSLSKEYFTQNLNSVFVKLDNQIAHVVHFPIYSNARKIARVFYGKWIDPLIYDLKENTRSEVFVFDSNKQNIVSTDNSNNIVDIKKISNLLRPDVISLEDSYYMINLISQHQFDNINLSIAVVRDITDSRKKEFYIAVLIIGIVVLLFVTIMFVNNLLLYKNFKPLYSAIEVLKGLESGRTDLEVKGKATGEVGQIASAVEAFRQSIISANTDALTGLPNRRNVMLKLDSAVTDFSLSKIQPFSIVIFDIDNFKHINDNYGHNIGDEILKIVSKAAQDVMRNQDLFARYGGEEFLAIIYESDVKTAGLVAERIRKNIQEAKATIEGKDYSVTVTAGVSCISEREQSIDLLELADRRLYEGKRSGKNKIITELKEKTKI